MLSRARVRWAHGGGIRFFRPQAAIDEIYSRWESFEGLAGLGLPSAPKKFLTVFREDNRPQTRLDRDLENGMGISVGRLREDCIFDYKFASLSHNTGCAARLAARC